jgi:hypothetical protein
MISFTAFRPTVGPAFPHIHFVSGGGGFPEWVYSRGMELTTLLHAIPKIIRSWCCSSSFRGLTLSEFSTRTDSGICFFTLVFKWYVIPSYRPVEAIFLSVFIDVPKANRALVPISGIVHILHRQLGSVKREKLPQFTLWRQCSESIAPHILNLGIRRGPIPSEKAPESVCTNLFSRPYNPRIFHPVA